MAFVVLKWQKIEKNGILDFLTNSKTVCRTEKIIKQKMQGAKSFVAPTSVKRGDGKKRKESYHSKVIAEKPQFFEKIDFRGL